jgi:hypothetical protein
MIAAFICGLEQLEGGVCVMTCDDAVVGHYTCYTPVNIEHRSSEYELVVSVSGSGPASFLPTRRLLMALLVDVVANVKQA